MSQSRLKALQTLKKLRVTESEQAKNDFAKALTLERNIESAIDAIKAEIAENKEIMRQNTADAEGQIIMEMSYYNWLGAADAKIEQKKYELTEAKEFTEQARQAMIKANTALEATDRLITQIEKEIYYQQEHKAQTEIDDIARTRFLHQRHKMF